MSSPAMSPSRQGLDALRSRMPRFPSRITPLVERAAVQRARLSVVPVARSHAPKVPFVILVTLILLGGVVGLLLFNTSMQQASFAATNLEAQATTLGNRQQTLEMELQDLRDPQRVAHKAQKLGMVPASSPAFLDLGSGKVVGNPKQASPDDGVRVRPFPEKKLPAPPPVVVTVPNPKDRASRPGSDVGNTSGDTAAASPATGAATGRNAAGVH